MTEYEATTLNLGYWQMIAAFLQASSGFVIWVVQCVLIYVGLRRIGQASDERKSQHEEAMEAMRTQREEIRTQHEATMRALDVQHEALRELIARTAKRSLGTLAPRRRLLRLDFRTYRVFSNCVESVFNIVRQYNTCVGTNS